MAPQSSDRIAEYIEHYLFWVGPVHTKENLYKGKGLLFDSSKVGIAKEAGNAKDGENGKGDDHTSDNK